MQNLEEYLTADGWKKDWEETRSDLGQVCDYLSLKRRPTIAGIKDPSNKEVDAFLEEDRMRNEGSSWGGIKEAYFAPKWFERSGHLYEALGVRLYKRIVMATAGRLLGRTNYPTNYHIGNNRTIANLNEFEKLTRFNETVHGCAMLLQFSVYFHWNSPLSLYLGFLEAALVVIQRYNRTRAYNTIDEKLKGNDFQ